MARDGKDLARILASGGAHRLWLRLRGASGDTACTDHMVAWRLRNALGLDQLQGVAGPLSGFDSAHPDNIIFDIVANVAGGGGGYYSPRGFGHPVCLNNPTATAVSGLPAVH